METYFVVDPHSKRRMDIISRFFRWAPAGCKLRAMEYTERRFVHARGVLVYDDCLTVVVEELISRGIWVPLFVYGKTPSTERVVKAIQSGALGYFSSPISKRAIREILANPKGKNPGLFEERRRRVEAIHRLNQLTRRERDVLSSMVKGATNKSIGRLLGISHRTVETHRLNLLGKLEAANSACAIRIACEAGLSPEGEGALGLGLSSCA